MLDLPPKIRASSQGDDLDGKVRVRACNRARPSEGSAQSDHQGRVGPIVTIDRRNRATEVPLRPVKESTEVARNGRQDPN